MMSHPMSAGGPGQSQIPPSLPIHPQHQQSRRQQEYHTYQHPPPQPPMHHNPYANYHHPPYYPLPAQAQYQPPRWQHQHSYPPQHYMALPPQQQAPYQPRSPMVVTSQPYAQSIPPITRQTSMPPPPPQSAPSPRPILQHVPQHPSAAPPSPAPTPKQEPELPMIQPEAPPAPSSRRQSQAQNPLSLPPEHKTPFYPKLPWYSTDAGQADFPTRAIPRRRRRQNLRKPTEAVALPTRENAEEEIAVKPTDDAPSETSTLAAPSEPETPATSQAPSESDFTQVSTPATPVQIPVSSPKVVPTQQHARRDTRTAIAIPNIPGLPKPKTTPPAAEKRAASQLPSDDVTPTPESQGATVSIDQIVEATTTPLTPPPKPAPKSWADLVRTQATAAKAMGAAGASSTTNGIALPKSASLADALKQYSVDGDITLSFLEPRGLVNTGNMCYMNSILQVLVFCAPFYSFLEQVQQRTVHSMKSDTPLVDAMIMFMREFKVLAAAESVAELRKRIRQEQVEQYGEPVTPEYVYGAIKELPRFQTMRRGHQQDAEEFLGFLLEGLHDECVVVMQGQRSEAHVEDAPTTSIPVSSPTSADGWLEVGPKQKASVTRTAGQQDAPSPITKIFGGHLRSELRVPGLKDSVTLEPYKPLQLDIGAQHVHNIIDALKGLTRTEALTGDFGGRGTTVKKQVFIDTLPPVLILHLKRFQYDNNLTGTQKIWKKVGYPLELEIPKEVFTPAKRGSFAVKGGLPKYRLISVVYHHGKSAAGGHYTVDVLRQDGREWMRMDDTIIRRIRPEDVAEGGSEEDPKLLAKALEQHKADQDMQKQRNMYQGLDEADREPEEEKPWSEVNGLANGGKKWTGVAANTNGTATPTSTTGKRTPTARKEGVKDNKVAYILLYERITG